MRNKIINYELGYDISNILCFLFKFESIYFSMHVIAYVLARSI